MILYLEGLCSNFSSFMYVHKQSNLNSLGFHFLYFSDEIIGLDGPSQPMTLGHYKIRW